ncbi:MAG: hypothetical protein HY078_08475 [Elusimicrobia bacterium]|nr:hypothetical protein [Elusimicrobiota bacterium]
MPATLSRRRMAETSVSIDYPRQDEVICTPRYTFRIGTSDDVRRAEIAIDQGDWKPCREDHGYWWHDWSGYNEGEHEVISRVESKSGKLITSEPHEFFVDFTDR